MRKSAPDTKLSRKRSFRPRGFKRASVLLAPRIRAVAETRGFAQADLLTRWDAVVGADLAAKASPVKVTYARNGMGATLVVLARGAVAHEVEMQGEMIRERVNACYGYNAISRIKVTQTAPVGFAEAQKPFAPPAPPRPPQKAIDAMVGPVADDGLKSALEALAANVLTRNPKADPNGK